MELGPGVVLAGRYRLERKIGEGGMGSVWAAKNLSVGTEVAVKTLKLSASANNEIVLRFRREAYLLACIHSDHVCRVLDFVSDEHHGHVLVLDFIRGESLHELLGKRRLTVEEALEIGTDVARGMLDLHRANIVHRDLKPGNILLEPRADGRFRALIVDFGLGRRIRTAEDESSITSMDTALGTLEYMAPEQILNSRGASAPADIYSLGAILYRSVTGRHLFGALQGAPLAQAKLGQEPPTFVTGRQDPVALGLEAIVNRALRKKPADRFASTDELLDALLALHRRREDGGRAVPVAGPLQPAPASAPGAMPVAAPLPARASAVAPGAAGGSPWVSRSTAPPQDAPTSKGRVRRSRGVPGVIVFFVALFSMVAGAAIGMYGERMRSAEARAKEAASASAAAIALPAPSAPASAAPTTSAAAAAPSDGPTKPASDGEADAPVEPP